MNPPSPTDPNFNHYINRVVNLKEVIKTTNNGYLFAPKPEDVFIAMMAPAIFRVTFDYTVRDFPMRISLI